MAWADHAFSELPPEEAPRIHAALRNKAGAFDHVVHKLNSTQAQLADALAKLAEYEESKPGAGELPKGAAAEDEDTMEGMMNRLERLGTAD
jgi:hypothetical protein